MTNLMKYNAANINQLMERLQKNTIGMDNYFDEIFTYEGTNYPPYNLISVNDAESRLELALAGFKPDELKVYTEYGKLVVEAKKIDSTEVNYVHRGLAQRSFTRSWNIADDTEVSNVTFENGLLEVTLKRIVPEKHQKKFYLGDDVE